MIESFKEAFFQYGIGIIFLSVLCGFSVIWFSIKMLKKTGKKENKTSNDNLFLNIAMTFAGLVLIYVIFRGIILLLFPK